MAKLLAPVMDNHYPKNGQKEKYHIPFTRVYQAGDYLKKKEMSYRKYSSDSIRILRVAFESGSYC